MNNNNVAILSAVNNSTVMATVAKPTRVYKLSAETRKAAAAAKRASRLRSRLSGGIVEFFFLKKDGTVRHAFGTTLSTLVGPKIKGTGKSGVERGVVTFWDVEKAAWRSCTVNSIMSIVPKGKTKTPATNATPAPVVGSVNPEDGTVIC